MGWGKDPGNRQKIVVRNPMRSTDYVFEVIRLQSIPGLLPQFVEDHYGGYGNRKERADFLNYLSAVGPQVRYGFSLPYLPLFKENQVAIQRPIQALEPAIRLQILSFLEAVTPGDIEETRETIMLNPSEVIQDDYKMVVLTTRDGRTYLGNITAENDRQITLRTVGQDGLVINKSDIQTQEVSNASLMPEGLLNNLTDQEVIDLIGYLRTSNPVLAAN